MNRARMAARAAQNPTITGRHSGPGVMPVLPPSTVAPRTSARIRRTKARMTGAQRNSIGQRSEWSKASEYVSLIECDKRWSA